MLVILPFHSADEDAALLLSEWIAELGTVEKHQCLIVHDKHASAHTATLIEDNLKAVFRNVAKMPLRESAPGTQGMNLLFRRTLRQIQHAGTGPFLWMNPDSIPLRREWLDAIDAAWSMMPRGKFFLGWHHHESSVPHMSAVGVYSEHAEREASNLVLAHENPFNLNAAPQMMPKMAATTLIVDSGESPMDIAMSRDTENVNRTSLALLDGAVLWHGCGDCKSGDLVRWLRDCADLPGDQLRPLPVAAVVKPREEKAGTFEVPSSDITKDRMASVAAGRAGSEGLPADEIDTNTVVPRVRPPVVDPVRKSAAPPVSPLKMTGTPVTVPIHREQEGEAEAPQEEKRATITVNVHNVKEVATALAGFRDRDAASKATVLGALRQAGFPIAGKRKQGGAQ